MSYVFLSFRTTDVVSLQSDDLSVRRMELFCSPMTYLFDGWSYFAVQWPMCSTDGVILQYDDLCVRRMELFCSTMTYVFDGWSYFAVR